MTTTFIKNAFKTKKSTINGNGNQTRDFIYIDDVIKANNIAIKYKHNDIFNISANQETSINKLHELVMKLMSLNQKPLYKNTKTKEQERSLVSNVKSETLFKWKPKYSLSQGIKETIENYDKTKIS